MNNTLCIYHANCADGLGSAWAVHRALGSDVEFLAAAYGDAPPVAEGRDVLIVDFSYSLEVLRALAQRARSVLVLDHHRTAQKDLAELLGPFSPWERHISRADDPYYHAAPHAVFDMSRSGAGLTWDYLTEGAARPHIIDLIEDRDLWRFRYGEETRAFHAVLTSYDNTDLPAALTRLDNWHIGAEENCKEHPILVNANEWLMLLAEGDAILRYELALVAGIVRGTRRTMRIAGVVVPVACVPGQLASEAGNLMCQSSFRRAEYPGNRVIEVGYETIQIDGIPSNTPVFSATYYDGADGLRHFSLRSPEGGANVGAVAKLYGGGGHEHAAGFVQPIGWEGE